MCTSIYQTAMDGSHVLSRTMDWPELVVSPIFFPRHYSWQTQFDQRTIYNLYSMVGGGRIMPNRSDISDGVNEWGLCAQKLTFTNGAKFDDEAKPGKRHLAAFEFIFWVLGNFKSIADLEEKIDYVQLMSELNSKVKFGNPELHFSLMDRTGRVVVIEPTHSPLRIIENPLGVVTNSPNFERQLAQLDKYVDFSDEFKNGTLPVGAPKVTTGNLSGKSTPPGSYAPGARFIRAAYLKERADQPVDTDDAIVSSWHLLNSVTVPKSLGHQPTYSVYRSAMVAETRTYYFQAYSQMKVQKLQLTDALWARVVPKIYPVNNQLETDNLN